MIRKVSILTALVALLVLGWSTLAVAQETKYYDPVCTMAVRSDTPHYADFEGKTYYFCTEACKTKFSSEPAKYACYCLSDSNCLHCTGKVAYCDCEKARHTHEHCHGRHHGGR